MTHTAVLLSNLIDAIEASSGRPSMLIQVAKLEAKKHLASGKVADIARLAEVIREERENLDAYRKAGLEFQSEAAYTRKRLLEYALSLVVGHEINTPKFEKIVSGK
jgi:hypothetical protein